GKEATQTLAAFFEMIADDKELPKMEWSFHGNEKAVIDVSVSQPIKEAHLWTADSSDRDLRDDKWTSKDLKPREGNRAVTATLSTPDSGYRAYLAEVVLTSPSGHDYKISTE